MHTTDSKYFDEVRNPARRVPTYDLDHACPACGDPWSDHDRARCIEGANAGARIIARDLGVAPALVEVP